MGTNNLIHRLDARIKLLSVIALILAVVLTPNNSWQQFLSYLILISVLILLSGISPLTVVRRLLMVLPFILLITVFIPFFKEGTVWKQFEVGFIRINITKEGMLLLINVLIKSCLSTITIVLLSLTTNFFDLLTALSQLKFPRVMIMLLSFMYRYVYVLIEEARRMERARNNRYFGGRLLQQISMLGNLIAILFIRALERGERVYLAACSRGFDGKKL